MDISIYIYAVILWVVRFIEVYFVFYCEDYIEIPYTSSVDTYLPRLWIPRENIMNVESPTDVQSSSPISKGENGPEESPGVKEFSVSDVGGIVKRADVDDERLAEMGYKPELHREFGLISCLALGFTVS